MKAQPRFMLIVTALMLGFIMVACSNNQPSSVNGPASSLERRDGGIRQIPELTITECEIKANDLFGGADMPFELTCENMAAAEFVVVSEDYNSDGCLIEQRGEVVFTDSGHQYSYRATTHGCLHDGGMLTVCSNRLNGCQAVELPRLTTVNSDVFSSSPK